MAPNLSDDLVEDILSRVPATSLKRLRSACKKWNALFKDKRFGQKHFANATKQFMILILKDNRVCPMNFNLHRIASPSVELCLTDSNYNLSKNVSISRVFHCDGLLLCTTNEYMLVVWNPFLEETRWIQPKNAYAWFALGCENTSSSCPSYKILKYWNLYDENSQCVYKFEIFELSSDSWRVLDDVVNTDECVIQSSTGVSLKGNTYWLAYKEKVFGDRVLLSFDFSTERFRRICLPFQDSVLHTIALSVVRDEKLVLLHQSFETLWLDIWVTTNIDQTKDFSWRKFLTADFYTHNFLFSYDVNFFIEEEKKVAMWIGKRGIVCSIGEDSKYREVTL